MLVGDSKDERSGNSIASLLAFVIIFLGGFIVVNQISNKLCGQSDNNSLTQPILIPFPSTTAILFPFPFVNTWLRYTRINQRICYPFDLLRENIRIN